MWERFTEKARRVIVLAQEEATRLGHGYVGTEHILLGLIKEKQNVVLFGIIKSESNVAVKTLGRLGVDTEVLRNNIEAMVIRGEKHQGQIVFTTRAKTVLELAFDEARYWGHDYIGTEHLLLGLIREGEGIAGRVLLQLGVNLEKAETQIATILGNKPQKLNQRTKIARKPQLCPHCGKDIHEPPEEKKEEQGGA